MQSLKFLETMQQLGMKEVPCHTAAAPSARWAELGPLPTLPYWELHALHAVQACMTCGLLFAREEAFLQPKSDAVPQYPLPLSPVPSLPPAMCPHTR